MGEILWCILVTVSGMQGSQYIQFTKYYVLHIKFWKLLVWQKSDTVLHIVQFDMICAHIFPWIFNYLFASSLHAILQ